MRKAKGYKVLSGGALNTIKAGWLRALPCAAALATAALVSPSAVAAPIGSDSGLANPDQWITFSELTFSSNTVITNQFASLGITLSPGHHYNSQGSTNFPGIDDDYVGVSEGIPFSIFFDSDVTEATFGYAKNPTTVLVEALNNGVVQESFNQSVHHNVAATSYLGFSGIVFDEIRVTANVNEGLVDNIAFTRVPEPASLLMMTLGGLMLGSARRR